MMEAEHNKDNCNCNCVKTCHEIPKTRLFASVPKQVRGAIKKNVPKSGKSPKGGRRGSAPEIKKSTIQNADFLIRGGVKKIVDFFHFLGHFFFDCSPKVLHIKISVLFPIFQLLLKVLDKQ